MFEPNFLTDSHLKEFCDWQTPLQAFDSNGQVSWNVGAQSD